jgi:hypothetical protein
MESMAGRTATAMSWLCRLRSCFGREVDLHVGDVGAAAHEVVPHQAVEVERRRRAGVDLRALDLRHRVQVCGDILATACVVSSVVPSGRSRITWNSLLLSNGSIFTCTSRTQQQADGQQQQPTTAP